ncbi:MAG: GTPase HflX [Thermoclostridium sp.]|nr:GTPase HflX [Thermoclostridium sp.]
MQVNGQTDGMKRSALDVLEQLYDIKIPRDQIFTEEMVFTLAEITCAANREIAVYIDRKGNVQDVRVGDSKTVSLSAAEGRRKETGITGVRCIHTHPGGSTELSELDISTLKQLHLDMMVAIGTINGKVTGVSAAILDEELENAEVFGPFRPMQAELHSLMALVTERDKPGKELNVISRDGRERALLIGIETPQTAFISGVSEAEISMKELIELSKTAGAEVVEANVQKRPSRDAAYLVGKGKLKEISQTVQTKEIDLIVFDEELSSSQLRNIEAHTGVKVVDRTGLILDIFAGRAKSREGRVQVELAQLNYLLPKLAGQGTALSRLGGGIGTRGPGETQLETDRRHIRRRIDYLKSQLQEIQGQRKVVRREREKNKMPVVAIVGYTNAGKSTLLNTLCSADVFAEDKLFATLDTTTRKLKLDDAVTVLLSDTVGFIRKLPHHLVEAFKATLEEAVLSDLLLIVADASDPFAPDHIRVVDEILNDLGASGKPSIVVWNKWDKVAEDFRTPYFRDAREEINVSALTGMGLDDLRAAIKQRLETKTEDVKLNVPFSEGWVLPYLYENGSVKTVAYSENNSMVEVEIDKKCLSRIRPFIVQPSALQLADLKDDSVNEIYGYDPSCTP